LASGSPPCRLGCVPHVSYPLGVTRGLRTARRTLCESTDSAMRCAQVTRSRSVATVSPSGEQPPPAIDAVETDGRRSPARRQVGETIRLCHVVVAGRRSRSPARQKGFTTVHLAVALVCVPATGAQPAQSAARTRSLGAIPVAVDKSNRQNCQTVCRGRLLHGGEGRPAARPTLADRREEYGERRGDS
jgi:hypothetical protein